MITHKEALGALFAALHERAADNLLHSASEEYLHGSCDRWAMAITELSRSPERGRILDIGAFDGIFCSALIKLGYPVAAVDRAQSFEESWWQRLGIEWRLCHIEADPIPYPDETFTGVYMGQVLEHITYSPREPLLEVLRVLKPGGFLVVDVPNVGELHNFYRLIRGKNVLYDYKTHYIDYEPEIYKGRHYFERHNREFTPGELRILAETCGFQVIRTRYIRSRRHAKKGLRRLEVPFTALRDLVPLFRKSIMLTAQKPAE